MSTEFDNCLRHCSDVSLFLTGQDGLFRFVKISPTTFLDQESDVYNWIYMRPWRLTSTQPYPDSTGCTFSLYPG